MSDPQSSPVPHRSADTVLNESFLELRAKLLEVAATLDRIDRSSDTASLGDAASQRRDQINQAIDILLGSACNRAEQIQHLFSRPYEPEWRKSLNV